MGKVWDLLVGLRMNEIDEGEGVRVRVARIGIQKLRREQGSLGRKMLGKREQKARIEKIGWKERW